MFAVSTPQWKCAKAQGVFIKKPSEAVKPRKGVKNESITKGQMPDGTEVQIEEWSETYSFYAYGSLVAAYPKNRYGEKVRASKIFVTAEEAAKAFNALKNGDKALADFNFTVKESGRDIPYQEKL